MRTIVALLIVILGSFAVGSCWGQSRSTPAVDLPSGSAVISDMKGEVFVTLPHQTEPTAAQKGQLVGPDTTVEVKKGSALLALSDGSQVLLKSNTRVIVRIPEQAKGNFLEQLIGKITATVKKRSGVELPFKLGTPTAVITVRGTRFEAEVTRRNQTFVSVYEGLVQVEGLTGSGHPVYLQPGYVTQIGMNREPENPRRLVHDTESDNESASSQRTPGRGDDAREGKQSGSSPASGDSRPDD